VVGQAARRQFAAQPVIALLQGGMAEALTHGSDNSLAVTRPPLSSAGKVQRITWKEVFR
jgi:hypothetical protein